MWATLGGGGKLAQVLRTWEVFQRTPNRERERRNACASTDVDSNKWNTLIVEFEDQLAVRFGFERQDVIWNTITQEISGT